MLFPDANIWDQKVCLYEYHEPFQYIRNLRYLLYFYTNVFIYFFSFSFTSYSFYSSILFSCNSNSVHTFPSRYERFFCFFTDIIISSTFPLIHPSSFLSQYFFPLTPSSSLFITISSLPRSLHHSRSATCLRSCFSLWPKVF